MVVSNLQICLLFSVYVKNIIEKLINAAFGIAPK